MSSSSHIEEEHIVKSDVTEQLPTRSSFPLINETSPTAMQDSDNTVRVGQRGLAYHAEIIVQTEDDDATVRAPSRFAHIIEQAAQVEQATSLQKDDASYVQTRPLLKPSFLHIKKPTRKRLLIVGCALCLVVLTSLFGTSLFIQSSDISGAQLLVKDKAQLDDQIHYAQQLGVSTVALQPVLRQEQQLTQAHAPFFPFSRQPILAYYQNSDARYHLLQRQVADSITNTMQQAQTAAQQAMQDFQAALSRGNTQGLDSNPYFARLFSQDQLLLSSASTIAQYEQISTYAREAIQSIALMQVTFKYLQDFQTTIVRLQKTRLDVTAMQAEYVNDVQLFQSATTSSDFQNLNGQINAQYQQTVVNAVQTFPYVGATKLNELQTQIQLLHTYGIDTTGYQARLNADQVTLTEAKTVNDDLAFIQQVDSDIAVMQDDLLRGESHYLLQQYHQEVNSWAKAHPYYDSYDGHNYLLDNGYTATGIAAGLDSDLASADNAVDYQTVIAEANNALFNLHQFERDYMDHTPYNQVHVTDNEILTHYKLQHKQVLLVSLAEQAMRVYQNGKLVNAYHVTTGRQELPSLPGVWSVLDRKSPIIFKAAEPKGSPYWFPDTPISYAILYHWGGYFVHDAPWRADFGPGTQFPHQDSSGTTAYNFDGSHGCINLSESDAGWIYKHTDWNTVIAIY